AQERIELLGRLPELIKNAASDSELFVRLINLLLAGVPRADAAALVAVEEASAREAGPSAGSQSEAGPLPTTSQRQVGQNQHIQLLHWDGRRLAGANFHPSQRLIQQALVQRETVLHTWAENPSREYTQSESIDWAYCTPLPGDACRGWALYLAGRFA